MKIFAFLGTLFAFIGGSFHGCHTSPSSGPVVARVGDHDITVEDLRDELRHKPLESQAQFATHDGSRQLLNELITRELTVRAALKEGIDKSPYFQMRLERVKREMLAGTYHAVVAQRSQTSSDDKINTYLSTHMAEFHPRLEFRISHIVTSKPADQQKALQLLQQGVSFADVARRLSIEPNAKVTGGALPPIREGTRSKEYEKRLLKMKKGSIAVMSKNEIVHKEGAITMPRSPMGEVAVEIRNRLTDEAVNEALAQERLQTRVQIDEKALYSAPLLDPAVTAKPTR